MQVKTSPHQTPEEGGVKVCISGVIAQQHVKGNRQDEQSSIKS
jgi:hypothetical protein